MLLFSVALTTGNVDRPAYIEQTPTGAYYTAADITRVLLQHGADIHVEDREGHTVLQSLYLAKLNLIYSASFQKYKYSYYMCVHQVSEILLQNGAKLRSKNGDSALCYVSSAETAKLMLKYHRQELNTTDKAGHTPLYTIINRIGNSKEKSEVLVFLLENGAIVEKGIDVIKLAHENLCDIPEIEKLLELNPDYDINTVDKKGETILSHCGITSTKVKKLLNLGADLSKANKSYIFETLHNACIVNDTELVRLFLDNGVDVYIMSAQGSFLIIIFEKCCFVTGDIYKKWYELFQYYLNLPELQEDPLPPPLQQLYAQLTQWLQKKAYDESYELQNLPQVLACFCNSNKAINSMCMEVGGIKNGKIGTEPMSMELFTFAMNIIMMESIGYFGKEGTPEKDMRHFVLNTHDIPLSNTPANFITPLTLLLLGDIERDDEYELMKHLIQQGVNVESVALEIETYVNYVASPRFIRYLNKVRRRFDIPDVLYITFLQQDKEYAKIFLSHWWAPPLTMLLLADHHSDVYFWLSTLVEYGGIPHGTQIHQVFMKHMKKHEKKVKTDMSLHPISANFKQAWNKYCQLKCKYKKFI